MAPANSVSVADVPLLIVKVRLTPVVALLLRFTAPLNRALPLPVASKVIPTPLVVVLEKAISALAPVPRTLLNVIPRAAGLLAARVKVVAAELVIFPVAPPLRANELIVSVKPPKASDP